MKREKIFQLSSAQLPGETMGHTLGRIGLAYSAWLSCPGVQVVHCTRVTQLKECCSLQGCKLISTRAHTWIHRLWSPRAGDSALPHNPTLGCAHTQKNMCTCLLTDTSLCALCQLCRRCPPGSCLSPAYCSWRPDPAPTVPDMVTSLCSRGRGTCIVPVACGDTSGACMSV